MAKTGLFWGSDTGMTEEIVEVLIDIIGSDKVDSFNIFNASIDDPEYGAAIAAEWGVKSVPTIIRFEYGKEIKRFEAGLSFKLDKDTILKQINNQIDDIQLRKFR